MISRTASVCLVSLGICAGLGSASALAKASGLDCRLINVGAQPSNEPPARKRIRFNIDVAKRLIQDEGGNVTKFHSVHSGHINIHFYMNDELSSRVQTTLNRSSLEYEEIFVERNVLTKYFQYSCKKTQFINFRKANQL